MICSPEQSGSHRPDTPRSIFWINITMTVALRSFMDNSPDARTGDHTKIQNIIMMTDIDYSWGNCHLCCPDHCNATYVRGRNAWNWSACAALCIASKCWLSN